MSSYKSKTLKYEIIKGQILSMIESGVLKPGDKVPTEQELADSFSVSVTTTRKALQDLAREGVIRRIKKKGTFVNFENEKPINDKMNIISFVLPLCEKSNNNLLQYVYGAQEYLTSRGYSMIIEGTKDEVELENTFIEQAVQKNLSGVLLFPTDPEQNVASLLKLQRSHIPFVLIDRYPENFPSNTVICNNFDGAFQSTKHLIQLGHEKILFVTHVGTNQAEITRSNGYRQAMKGHGLSDDFPILSCHQTDEILSKIQTEHFTAIVCANDYCALELSNFLSNKGISIPKDVSIIGFDGQKATEYTTPPISTIIQPCFEIGKTAAKILVEHIESPQKALEQAILPVTLQLRSSSAVPR